MGLPFKASIVAVKKYFGQRQTQKRAKREKAPLAPAHPTKRKPDANLSNPKRHFLDDAITTETGLGTKASRKISPARPIPCSKPRLAKTEPSTGRTGRQAPVGRLKVNVDVDPRFIDNPIGVGSYKTFESPISPISPIDIKSPSSRLSNLSPTSTKFSASSGTTLNEEEDICDTCHTLPGKSPPFDHYYGPKQIDWAKGKRKGKQLDDEEPEVTAVKDYVTHVDQDNAVIAKVSSRGRMILLFQTLTK